VDINDDNKANSSKTAAVCIVTELNDCTHCL